MPDGDIYLEVLVDPYGPGELEVIAVCAQLEVTAATGTLEVTAEIVR